MATIKPSQQVMARYRPDGTRYQVKGYIWDETMGRWRCPTELCKALCCRTHTLWPDTPPPCEYLTTEHYCSIHQRGGLSAKPFGCAIFPRSQADIDKLNKQAIDNDHCRLWVEELQKDDNI